MQPHSADNTRAPEHAYLRSLLVSHILSNPSTAYHSTPQPCQEGTSPGTADKLKSCRLAHTQYRAQQSQHIYTRHQSLSLHVHGSTCDMGPSLNHPHNLHAQQAVRNGSSVRHGSHAHGSRAQLVNHRKRGLEATHHRLFEFETLHAR